MPLCRFFFATLLIFAVHPGWAKDDTLTLYAPSGSMYVKVWMGKQLSYEVIHKDRQIVAPSVIDLVLANGQSISADLKIKSSSVKKVREQIVSPVPEKRRIIPDVYNQLTLQFRKPFGVEFRAYDDGIAYRIFTSFKDSVTVKEEVALIAFPGDPSVYLPEMAARHRQDIYVTSFEHNYRLSKLKDVAQEKVAYVPVLVMPEANPKIAIVESDLEDYPGLFLTGTASCALKSDFAAYPVKEKSTGGQYPYMGVEERADYIARTKGTRTFPWRILMVAEEDRDLPGNDLVYRLGAPSRIKETGWITPGNITDEWIIDINLFNVPFKAGLNTASYKYYIDFAKKFGFRYIMMDAGWSDNADLFKVHPDIDMDTLTAYAKEQGVKIAMWTLGRTLEIQLDSALKQFNKWGVDFIMTDFINRDDQKAVNFHHRIAQACADHKIMIMFHGSFPPKGFNRTWPHAITREGVFGSEFNIFNDRVTPDHDVLIPFIRMLAGSLDYEPGILNNATKKSFRATSDFVMSYGTRMHQLSMYVVFDSPMQFFAGNPSQGLMEPEFMSILGSIPSVWEETTVLDAKVGEYIVTARKSGDNWHIGAMTNWSERKLSIGLDFLEPGVEYAATFCKDGVNAVKYPADYAIEKKTQKKGDTISIPMAPGGGFYLRLEKLR